MAVQRNRRLAHARRPERLPMIKRALLGLAGRAGYSILKNADYERLAQGEAKLADLEVELAQAKTEFAKLECRLAQAEAERADLEVGASLAKTELAELKCQLAQAEAERADLVAELVRTTRTRDEERRELNVQLRQTQRDHETQLRAVRSLERELASTRTQMWKVASRANEQNKAQGCRLDAAAPSSGVFYIVHFPYHHDRLYGENLDEFFAEAGIETATILLDDPSDGQRPQLAECLSGDAIGVIGFNSQLDHSYIGPQPFLQAAEERGVPVIQWMLDHPSSRIPEFGNSTPGNSRFLFSAESAERYFRRYGIKNALTSTVACVGPSRHSRARNSTYQDFSKRPIAAMVAMNLTRIGGTIDDAWNRVRRLEPRLRQAVEATIEVAYPDAIQPLEVHFEAALTGAGLDIGDMDRHACMQMVEEIVQIRRRQKIFEVAREFPILIQSDAPSRPYQAGAKAEFKENQDVAVTWSRLKLTRAHVSISNMHDMIHDRILNGLNAGCLNIIEDNSANRRLFQHGCDALFFRYDDDSLRECLEFIFADVRASYDIAAAGFARRDDAPFRFGDFKHIVDLARRALPDRNDRT
jgi:hypothetical protein